MAKRLLKNIASGLLGTFVSRNNDIDGYWALGILRLIAEKKELYQIDLNLIESDSKNRYIKYCEKNYSDWLQKTLERYDLSLPSLLSAKIYLRFENSFDTYPNLIKDTRGLPYVCTVELGDTTGKLYTVVKVGVCSPHDPRKEYRSTRV